MVILFDISGNTKSKFNVDHVSKIVTEGSKTQNIDADNFTKTLDSIHACDKPPRNDDVDKMFNENTISKLVIDTFIDGILHDYPEDTEDSCDEESLTVQDNDVNDIDILNMEEEKYEYLNLVIDVYFDDGEPDDDGD